MRWNLVIIQAALIIGNNAQQPIYNDTANWPQNSNGLSQLFHTMPYYPDAIELEYQGRIPSYISGTVYRNGPGIYEWGNTTYDHMFDPNGILQAIRIQDGRVMYNSNVIKSRNYHSNNDAQQIIKPEIGTYAEPDWVTTNSDGTPIEVESVIIENRLAFLDALGYSTDNTIIQTYPIFGRLVSMSETPYWNYHDPYTLETLGQLDVTKSENFPKGFLCITQTAHPHFDRKTGDLHNVMSCLKLPSKDNIIPRVAYIPYAARNAARKSSNQFLNPSSEKDIIDSIEFGEPFYNTVPTDLSVRYFHMLLVTENYIIVLFTSLKIDMVKMLGGVIVDTEPMTKFMIYDVDLPGEFIVIHKNTLTAQERRFHSNPYFLFHAINAYEKTSEPNKIIIDATAREGNIMEHYYYKYLNSTNEDYQKLYAEITPIGVPKRYILDLDEEPNSKNIVNIEEIDHFPPTPDTDFPCFEQGGVEFPIINYYGHDGLFYDHYWACGFGEILPDRLYHVKMSTKERFVWQTTGYSPSEPAFIPNPYKDREDAGVIVSLVSPYTDPEAHAFIVFLNAEDMTEIARAEMPSDYYIPIGFHSYFVSDDNLPSI